MSKESHPDGIAILDFGGQYCHLIARRVREMNVYTEILPSDAKADEIRALGAVMNVRGIVFSGSPSSVKAGGALTLDPAILELGVPVLGLCYGLQLLADMHGGELVKARAYGVTEAYIDEPVGGLEGLEACEPGWVGRGGCRGGRGAGGGGWGAPPARAPPRPRGGGGPPPRGGAPGGGRGAPGFA